MHITGFGDYKIKDVEVAEEPLPAKSKFENKSNKNDMEVEKSENNKNKKNLENKEIINNDIFESKKNMEMLNNENLPEKVEDLGEHKKEEKKKKLWKKMI